MQSLQDFIIAITLFINNILIPFLFGLALLFFIWNAFRYLVLGGSSDDAKDHAKDLMLYSIGAFVVLVSFWGIVNLLVSGLSLNNNTVTPDYMLNDPFNRENVQQREYCEQNPSSIDCR